MTREDLTAVEVAILKRGGFSLETEEVDADDPLVQTETEYAALLKTSLSTADAARRLGVDPSRIRRCLTSHPPTLYGIHVGRSWYILEFQFDGDRLLHGLDEVVSRLDPEFHPVAVFRWFITPNGDLSTEELGILSPRDWLRSGLPVEAVAEIASNL